MPNSFIKSPIILVSMKYNSQEIGDFIQLVRNLSADQKNKYECRLRSIQVHFQL